MDDFTSLGVRKRTLYADDLCQVHVLVVQLNIMLVGPITLIGDEAYVLQIVVTHEDKTNYENSLR